MLDKNEEVKLNTILKIIETSKDFQVFPKLSAYEIEWLAEKCKELNVEAAGYYESYMKVNRDLIALDEERE